MIKKILLKISIILLIIILVTLIFDKHAVEDIKYTELGIPLSNQYSEGITARCPWDMIIWNENLYIGGGDYDNNAGPVPIWCYDIAKKSWRNSGNISNEEIYRFCVINDTLIIPGIDPMEYWKYGNYYRLESEMWNEIRNIPGGMHNFDMVEYEGIIFAGLGVSAGEYPIVCSYDGGITFNPVEMLKDGNPLDTSKSDNVRVYDLFIYNKILYASFMYGDDEISYDLYRYENGIFVYDNQWCGKIHQIKYTNNIIGGKTEFSGHIFFTTGYLYATSDMTNFTRIIFPNNMIVYDIYASGSSLYALCGEKLNDGKYRISVWENSSQVITAFEEKFDFVYEIPPLSFVYHRGEFYIGMGDRNYVNEKNGMIIYINFEK